MKTSFRRRVGRGSLAAALAAMLPLAFAVPARADDAVDQSLVMSPWPSSRSSVSFMAQTFKAHVTGQIDKVSIPADTPSHFAGADIVIEGVTKTGVPDDTHIGTTSGMNGQLVGNGVNGDHFHDFTFPPPGVPVTAGIQYAIVIVVWGGNFKWYDSGSGGPNTSDPYTDGKQYLGYPWATTNHLDFGFKEWVATNVNSAPAVATDRPGVSVPEGTVPTMTGTYSDADGDTVSDADGDTVSLSATPSGTVKWTGTSSGTWQWTGTASDEAPTQTVVITADDGHGLTNTTSFTLDVTKVAPTAKILTDALSVSEGAAVPFTGGATTPFAGDGPSTLLSWAVSQNGANVTTGSGSAFSFTPADEGAYQVTLTATDDGGMPNTTLPVTVVETEITPTATVNPVVPTDPMLRSPLIITPGESLNFSGNFSDAAGSADSHTVSWNFGDGTPAATAPSTGAASTTHSYALAGTYTVTLTASDDDNASGAATTQVTVQTAQQSLSQMITYVQGLTSLNEGQRKSLIAKLNAASDSAARGDNKAAGNQLNAFLNELLADYNTKKISDGAYNTLRMDAHTVQGALGTYNRFLEWWPLQA